MAISPTHRLIPGHKSLWMESGQPYQCEDFGDKPANPALSSFPAVLPVLPALALPHQVSLEASQVLSVATEAEPVVLLQKATAMRQVVTLAALLPLQAVLLVAAG